MGRPSRRDVEKIVECHRRKDKTDKKKVTLKEDAVALLLLYHWTFLKKLANACDIEAFRHKRIKIEKEDVDKVAPRVLLAYNEYEKVRKKRRMENVASSSLSPSSSYTTKEQQSSRFTTPTPKTNLSIKMKKKVQPKRKRSSL